MTKRLTFKSEEDGAVHEVFNKTECIGYIDYYKKWKCWVFNPEPGMVYSADCMQEIVEYMGAL